MFRDFELGGKRVTVTFEYARPAVTFCYVTVWNSDGTLFDKYEGVSLCVSTDQFSKEKGRKIALTRAIGFMPLSKAARRLLWKKYFECANKPHNMNKVTRKNDTSLEDFVSAYVPNYSQTTFFDALRVAERKDEESADALLQSIKESNVN